jgi:DHA1 family multidrug resistance protein-like MFS transporter
MKKNNKNLGILFFTLVVVMMGFGIIIPILPFYVESFGASGKGLGLLMAIFSIMQFIFAPIWGALSDRFGRKPILLIGVLGNAISLLFFGLSTQMWMMYASRALAGILSSATMPTAMAYIGDTTDEKNRGGGMGVIGAAMGVGMVLGPGIGGTLANTSLSLPFFVAAALSVVALILIVILLPESLEKDQRDELAKVEAPNFSMLWKALFGPLGFLLLLAFSVSFAMTNFEGVFGLYAQYRFDYDPGQVGLVMTVVGLVSAIVQGGLTGPATRWIGERNVIKISLFGSAIGFGVMLLAFNGLTVYLTVGFFILMNSMLRPSIASIISREATSGQGIAMGLNNSFMSLGRIFGPLWAGTMFDINLSYPYLTGMVVLVILFVASLTWLKSRPLENRHPVSKIEQISMD